jgi:excisionase family DNA binding protein
MTTAQAAQILDVTARRVCQLIATGQLAARKSGRDWSITPQALRRVQDQPRRRYPGAVEPAGIRHSSGA